MKHIALLFGVWLLFSVQSVSAQKKIPSYSSEDLLERLSNKDTLYVVNFWATWCVPCVKELPAFTVIADLYAGQPVKVLLVSFDFKEQYPGQLTSWVRKKRLRPEVVWFNESNPNQYIPKIAPEWSGTLPGTLLLNTGKGHRRFIANEVSADELKRWIDKSLK